MASATCLPPTGPASSSRTSAVSRDAGADAPRILLDVGQRLDLGLEAVDHSSARTAARNSITCAALIGMVPASGVASVQLG